MLKAGNATEADLEQIDNEIEREVADAVAFAEGSPWPDTNIKPGDSQMFA